MRDLGARAEATFVADLKRCRHPQAEPVILTTGELVACVCIGCYHQLPADYIAFQCDHSETMAYADFDRVPAGSRFRCVECGDWVSDSTTADHEG